jgi:hypothetical protein
MKLHAYYSHTTEAPALVADPETYIIPGDIMWGETYDWMWWSDVAPNAEILADTAFAELRHIDGLAVCRVNIEVPDEVWAEKASRDFWDDDGAFERFVDDVEWEHSWLHPAVTVVRQNDLSFLHRAANTARMLRVAELRATGLTA